MAKKKGNLGDLISQIPDRKPVTQKMVERVEEKNESSQTFFIDTDFKKFLKHYALTNENTVKDIITNALMKQYGEDFKVWKKSH